MEVGTYNAHAQWSAYWPRLGHVHIMPVPLSFYMYICTGSTWTGTGRICHVQTMCL